MMESFARLSRDRRPCANSFQAWTADACGAPSCKALAEDISKGEAKEEDCVYIMKEQLRKLMEQEKEEKR
ncbi:MAG: (Fe-S)-binding protein [Clostridium sp.]